MSAITTRGGIIMKNKSEATLDEISMKYVVENKVNIPNLTYYFQNKKYCDKQIGMVFNDIILQQSVIYLKDLEYSYQEANNKADKLFREYLIETYGGIDGAIIYESFKNKRVVR